MARRIYREIFFTHNDPPFLCFHCEQEVVGTVVVHHKNHNSQDHRVENLVAVHRGCHNVVHVFSGKTHTDETLTLMRRQAQARGTEYREKLSEALKGKPKSDAHKAAISASHRDLNRRKPDKKRCSCGLESWGGAMSAHLKATGHTLVEER